MTNKNQALLDDFVTESRELLEKAEGWLMALEASVQSPDLEHVQHLFRSIHSVKGSANFLGLVNIGDLSHTYESLLEEIRDGRLKISHEITDVLLRCNDRLRALVEDVGFSDEIDIGEEIAELQRWMTQAPPMTRARKMEIEEPVDAIQASAADSVRVKTAVLDSLLDAAGEMVMTRNRLSREIHRLFGETESVERILQQMNTTMTRMQAQIMRARLQPLTALLDRFRRVVRDLAAAHGKRVELIYSGDEVELDRAVLEVLSENLTHLLRNSVDHGIENEAERAAAGKTRVGTIRIDAIAQADSVLIDVQDDGAGIDVAGLRKAARAGGYWLEESERDLDATELMRLVCTPGLTTAREVSGLSGRGVGLDIVQGNVIRLGGAISVASEIGSGTRFRLKLPMTLLIIPALVVAQEQYRFAIPRRFIEKLCRVSDSGGRVRMVGDEPFLEYRGDLIPVLSLGSLLEIGSSGEGVDGNYQHIVVISVASGRVGLLVGQVLDHEDAVVTKLSPLLQQARCYSGTTVLGDGNVALVLDPQRLVERAGMATADTPFAAGPEPGIDVSIAKSFCAAESYLLCCTRDEDTCWALRTVSVRRIRKIKRGEPLYADGNRVVRHDDRNVRLIDSSLWTGQAAPGLDEIRYIIIAGDGDELIALAVGNIADVINAEGSLQSLDGDTKYLQGTIDFEGGVAGVLDLSALAADLARQGGEG